ncbi:MAG: hypothetical protein ACKVOR_06300 [Flavobacteriales bacterium]
MKHYSNHIFLFALLLLAGCLNAQTGIDLFNGKRTISVEGNATVFAEIDIIKTLVVISDEFCAGPQQNLQSLETTLENNLKAVGMTMKDAKLTKEDVEDLGYTNGNNANTMVRRSYEIVFNAARHYDTFKSLLPANGMSLEITELKSSKADEVKVDGLKKAYEDAEKTATDLLKISGGKLGQFLMITQTEPWKYGMREISDISEERLRLGIEIEIQLRVAFEVL